MPIFPNIGYNWKRISNQHLKIKGDFNSSHTSTRNIDNIKLTKSFLFCWLKAIAKKGIKTINKVPQQKDWTNTKQLAKNVEGLLQKFGEYGVLTAHRLGNKYFETIDIDIVNEKLPLSLQKRLEINFEFLAKIYHISYIKTKRGYHVYCLFDNLTPNEAIYHIDKYGKKRNIASILSKGRQVQGVGSKDKNWVNNAPDFDI